MTMAEKQELLREIARDWDEEEAAEKEPLPPQPPKGGSSPKGALGEG